MTNKSKDVKVKEYSLRLYFEIIEYYIMEKYPVGTKIRFINKNIDTNKIGVIVGYAGDNMVVVYLPTADKHIKEHRHPTLSDGTKFTWRCRWSQIELIAQKNEQLEFPFMED